MEKSPAYIKALEAINILSDNEKLQLVEAIGETLPEVWQEWLEKKSDAFYESDEEDIRLAEEALVEYRANPETAMEGDLFLQKLREMHGEQKPDKLYESDEEDIQLAEEALAEYRANPETAVPWDTFYNQQLERIKGTKVFADN